MTKRLTAIFLAVLTLAACGQGETAPGTMGTMLAQVFEERGKADPNLDLTDLGNTLMNDSGLPIDGEVTPVEPGLLMGFGNDEITGFAAPSPLWAIFSAWTRGPTGTPLSRH